MPAKVIDSIHPLLPVVTPQNLWVLGVQVAIILFIALVISLIFYRFFSRFSNWVNTKTYPYSSAFIKAAKIPLSILVWMLAIGWCLILAKPLIKWPILQSVPIIQKIVIIFLLASFLIHSIRTSYQHLKQIEFSNTILSPSVAEALCKLLQVAVFISAALILLQSIGISISGLLAFGGLGGLIVGLAAKDTLANLFGGMMIYMDRPFQVGERIKVPGKDIEGTVEHIGWRQTRVRNYELQPVYIPNSLFGSMPVLTPSRMFNRRIRHTVGLRYKDFSALSKILADIKDYLIQHEDIDGSRPLRVHFIEYGESSLNLQIYCFTHSIKRDVFLSTQQDVLLRIGQIIKDNHADFSFAVRTLDIDWPKGLSVSNEDARLS